MLNTNKIVAALTRHLAASGAIANFEGAYRMTVGFAENMVNDMLLHEDESLRSFFRQAREVFADMVKLPEQNAPAFNVQVFSALYGDLDPLAQAIYRDSVACGTLAVRTVDILKSLFNVWAAYANDDMVASSKHSGMLAEVALKVAAWHVARAALKVEREVPFTTSVGFELSDDDCEWLTIMDDYLSEFSARMECLTVVGSRTGSASVAARD